MRFTGDNGRKFDVGVYLPPPYGRPSFDQTITVYMPSRREFVLWDDYEPREQRAKKDIYVFKTKDPTATYNSMRYRAKDCLAEL